MNFKISILFLTVFSIGFSQELPKSISIHMTQFPLSSEITVHY